MKQLYIKLADIVVKIEHEEELLQKLASNYKVCESETDMEVIVSREEINQKENGTNGEFSRGQIESIIASQKIAERLPLFKCCLFHGAVITFQNEGYLFTAPSGTGKSTHIRLWKKYLGRNVDIVNGDKPILRFEEEEIIAHGTPWAGKENWQKNRSTNLKGICILKQGKENTISRIDARDAVPICFKQIFWPKETHAAGNTLEMLDKIVTNVPIYLLECDISEEAVKTSFEAMTNLSYNEYRCQNGEGSHEN